MYRSAHDAVKQKVGYETFIRRNCRRRHDPLSFRYRLVGAAVHRPVYNHRPVFQNVRNILKIQEVRLRQETL